MRRRIAARVSEGAADVTVTECHTLVPTQLEGENRVIVHRNRPNGAGDCTNRNTQTGVILSAK